MNPLFALSFIILFYTNLVSFSVIRFINLIKWKIEKWSGISHLKMPAFKISLKKLCLNVWYMAVGVLAVTLVGLIIVDTSAF